MGSSFADITWVGFYRAPVGRCQPKDNLAGRTGASRVP